MKTIRTRVDELERCGNTQGIPRAAVFVPDILSEAEWVAMVRESERCRAAGLEPPELPLHPVYGRGRKRRHETH